MNKYEALMNSYGAVVSPTMGHNLNSYKITTSTIAMSTEFLLIVVFWAW